jgi:hypothetical protein
LACCCKLVGEIARFGMLLQAGGGSALLALFGMLPTLVGHELYLACCLLAMSSSTTDGSASVLRREGGRERASERGGESERAREGEGREVESERGREGESETGREGESERGREGRSERGREGESARAPTAGWTAGRGVTATEPCSVRQL